NHERLGRRRGAGTRQRPRGPPVVYPPVSSGQAQQRSDRTRGSSGHNKALEGRLGAGGDVGDLTHTDVSSDHLNLVPMTLELMEALQRGDREPAQLMVASALGETWGT